MNKTIKVVTLSCGYVESNQIGHVIFTPGMGHPGFATKVEAIQSLANYLFERWRKDNWSSFLYICCGKTYDTEYGKNKFCNHCGKELITIAQSEEQVTPEQIREFRDWVRDLTRETCESVCYTFEEEGCWWPFNSPKVLIGLTKEEVCVVNEKAEHLMCANLGDKGDIWQCCFKQDGTFEDAVNGLCKE